MKYLLSVIAGGAGYGFIFYKLGWKGVIGIMLIEISIKIDIGYYGGLFK